MATSKKKKAKKKAGKSHGGARPGSGAKPVYGEPMVQVSIRLPEDLLTRLRDSLGTVKGPSGSQVRESFSRLAVDAMRREDARRQKRRG